MQFYINAGNLVLLQVCFEPSLCQTTFFHNSFRSAFFLWAVKKQFRYNIQIYFLTLILGCSYAHFWYDLRQRLEKIRTNEGGKEEVIENPPTLKCVCECVYVM